MSLGSISEALPYAIRIGFPLCAVVYIATGRAGRWPIFTWFLIATSIKTWATSPAQAMRMSMFTFSFLNSHSGECVFWPVVNTCAHFRRNKQVHWTSKSDIVALVPRTEMLMFTSDECSHAQTVATAEDAAFLRLALEVRGIYCPGCHQYHIEPVERPAMPRMGYS